ncbi:MAG: sodium-dependent bicarbonate transport family permease [Pseudomonadota bacterium]
MDVVTIAVTTLGSPMLVFFLLGVVFAALARDLQMPPAFSRVLAALLLFGIGVKGGAAIGTVGFGPDVATAIAAGVALSVAMTALAFYALRASVSLNTVDAAALAAHYGSISIVTFGTMTVVLLAKGIAFDGWMMALAAMMELPAVLTALVLARFAVQPAPAETAGLQGGVAVAGGGRLALGGGDGGRSMLETCLKALGDRGLHLLLGAFALGWLAALVGADWKLDVQYGLFPAVLCIFMLDQGLFLGRRLLRLVRRFDPRLALFAVMMPLVGGALGLITGAALGMAAGNVALLATLAASASYLAAPAVTRAALPGARPEIYLTFPLCLTLPFNLIVGLPLYLAGALWLAH